MRSTTQRWTWWRRSDPLVYVIGVAALIVYALHGFEGFLHRDLLTRGTNPTRHQTFSQGRAEYVDDVWPGGLRGFGEWVARE
jgi:hypothetical protein